jgi:hypothetical protein
MWLGICELKELYSFGPAEEESNRKSQRGIRHNAWLRPVSSRLHSAWLTVSFWWNEIRQRCSYAVWVFSVAWRWQMDPRSRALCTGSLINTIVPVRGFKSRQKCPQKLTGLISLWFLSKTLCPQVCNYCINTRGCVNTHSRSQIILNCWNTVSHFSFTH